MRLTESFSSQLLQNLQIKAMLRTFLPAGMQELAYLSPPTMKKSILNIRYSLITYDKMQTNIENDKY